MTFYIGFIADTHIGYRDGMKMTKEGVNIREQDGYDALAEVVDKLIQLKEEGKLHVVVHGGDLFHTSHPSIRSLVWVQYQLGRLHKAGIPFYGMAGNHDASDEQANIAAVAPINDPSKGIHALYKPAGRYKIEHPEAEGDIYLHAIAHHGLSANEAPEIEVIDGAVNILTTHGAAVHPSNKTLLHCMDSPREQIIPTEVLLNDDINIRLLGHYHTRGKVVEGTHYAGSTLRRGWSDDPGARGITLVGVEPDGESSVVEYIDIYQRPQYDLEVIDAKGLTAEEVEERVIAHLEKTKTDAQGNPIQPLLRQKVENVPLTVKNMVNRNLLHKAASHGLTWKLDMETEAIDKSQKSKAKVSLEDRRTFAGAGMVYMYKDFAKENNSLLSHMEEETQTEIIDKGKKYLEKAEEEGN